MRLVLHDTVCRQVEEFLDSVSDANSDLIVVGRFVPNGQNVFAVPNGNHNPTDLVADLGLKLVPNDGQDKALPEPGSEPFLDPQNPLAARQIVLPNGPNALLEEVVLGDMAQVIRALQVGVNGPELLDGAKVTDLFDGGVVVLDLGPWGPVHEPVLSVGERWVLSALLWETPTRRPRSSAGEQGFWEALWSWLGCMG